MFARRSLAEQYEEEIHLAASRAHTLVLGGDIFDFKWSTLGSVHDTVGASLEWLHRLITPHPACRFEFILGNHDATPVFVEQLDTFAGQHSHFHWHRYYLRRESCLFLHGDIADGETNHDRLEDRRGRCGRDTPQHPTTHLLYEFAVRAHLHRLAGSVAHPEKRVLRHLLEYSNHIGHGPEDGIQHVYFGHIHRVLDGIKYGGLTFHNGGAAIRGIQFRIVEAKLNGKRDG